MSNRMSRRRALSLFGGTVAGLPFVGRSAGTPRGATAPNLLFIMTDDQRQDAMGAYGNRILKTPHMDRIAAGGVRFTEAFVTNSLCGPSRASFLTGLYSHAHGIIDNDGQTGRGLRPEQPTFVELLKRNAGYHTGLVGKWHIESEPTGFDHWAILPGYGEYRDPQLQVNGTMARFRGHVDDVVGDQALEFLDARPKDRPFCLLYHFKSPHRSWEPASRYAHEFSNIEIPVPRTLEDRLVGRPEALKRAELAIANMDDFQDQVPASLPFEERRRRNLQHLVKNYYRVLLSVDDNVGLALDFLERNGLAENTIVVYTSDNGFFLGEHGLFDKRLMYEPSLRIPLLLRYPARIAAGVDSRHMVLNVDLMPTLLELCGVAPPAALHGRSFVPLLTGGKRPAPWREDFLYEYFEYPGYPCVHKHRGVRTARWKLIHFFERPEEWELYDLERDPNEMENLIGKREHARRIATLRERMETLRRELGDTDPPGPRPVAEKCT